jgi:hypothetical protein
MSRSTFHPIRYRVNPVSLREPNADPVTASGEHNVNRCTSSYRFGGAYRQLSCRFQGFGGATFQTAYLVQSHPFVHLEHGFGGSYRQNMNQGSGLPPGILISRIKRRYLSFLAPAPMRILCTFRFSFVSCCTFTLFGWLSSLTKHELLLQIRSLLSRMRSQSDLSRLSLVLTILLRDSLITVSRYLAVSC